MTRLRERIPREQFEAIFRPMVRDLGTRNVVLRLNEEARTAIPRQIKLAEFMPKLDLLVYERERPKADEELERLWNIYFDNRLAADDEGEDRFLDLSSQLNDLLDQDRMPQEEEKRAEVGKLLDAIEALLAGCEFEPIEIEAAFRIKAFPEVLDFYLQRREQTQADP